MPPPCAPTAALETSRINYIIPQKHQIFNYFCTFVLYAVDTDKICQHLENASTQPDGILWSDGFTHSEHLPLRTNVRFAP